MEEIGIKSSEGVSPLSWKWLKSQSSGIGIELNTHKVGPIEQYSMYETSIPVRIRNGFLWLS